MLWPAIFFVLLFSMTLPVFAEEIELIKNGDFEAGLSGWTADVFEYPFEDERFGKRYFACDLDSETDTCRAQNWGYPFFGISDDRSPGDRYFHALVPTFYWGAKTAVSLEQTVTIPESSKVTLSFDVQGYSQSQLHIFVKQESVTPILINQLKVNDNRYSWGDVIHREYDLTQYSGDIITLQFVASEYPFIDSVEEEVPNTGVYFYDVSLAAIPIPVEVADEPEQPDVSESFPVVYLVLIPVVVGVGIVIAVFSRKKKNSPIQESISENPAYKSESFHDQVLTQTGGDVPDSLKHNETESTVDLEKEPKITDVEYEQAISNDIPLRILWTLLKTPGHTFENRNKLRQYLEKSSVRHSRHSTYKPIFEELAKLDLINKIDSKSYANQRQKKYALELSTLGKQLMRTARDETITTWGKFKQRFQKELRK